MKRILLALVFASAIAFAQQPVTVANPSLAVTGAFWQSTQPVSGTFWQSTQPVSLASLPALVAGSAIVGKVGIDQTTPGTTNGVQVTNSSLAVTGTFWQSTQPVSGTFWQSTQPVSLASLPALVAGSATIGSVKLTDGTSTAVVDPCQANAKSFALVSLTAGTQVISGTSGKKTYVCSLNLVAGAATNVALVEGTGTTCATGIAGMAGGSTAATGWNFAANGGLTLGNGQGTVIGSATSADNVCILVSAANQISGSIAYVQQ
jgi:hypothetical protein